MKKALLAFITAALLLTTASCGESTGAPESTTAADSSVTTLAADSKEPSGFYFTAAGTDVLPGTSPSGILEALGEQTDPPFIAPSCAFQGDDKTYFFPGYEVRVNEEDGAEFIYTISLKDDSVTTPEGIYIGAPRSDVIAAYGEPLKEQNGVLVYTKGTTNLEIALTDETVSQILYIDNAALPMDGYAAGL
ncbi:MAG: hypothetical protein LBR73_03045 [Oscillospiraceae bacterium]|jgi:hypothetical protein|nr:hypothetical protein [Oscillospiraceae bacterium]